MKTEKELKRVLIMAGGTGGHVFPGLAVANYARSKGIDVQWLGTSQGLEARIVPEANIPLHLISIAGLRGKGFKTFLSAPFKISKAIGQSIQAIKKIKPDVVIGMGGFASGPGGIASWLMQKPLVIHEQNAKAGFTNKLLACFSKRVLEGFPSAFIPASKVMSVGNPVRSEIANLQPPEERLNPSRPRFRLLVLGGSLGAQALNEIVPRALAKLAPEERPEVLHQAGDKHIEATKKYYESNGLEVDLQAFIKDMAHAYAWADLVICRAGALTIAELCTVGLGSILIPFPAAVDDHQTVNAQYLVQKEAAICMQQTELTDEKLANILKQFAHTPEKRLAMAKAAYKLRKINVAEQIFDILAEVVKQSKS